LRGRQLQVRSGVQPVGLELADLTQAEAAKLQPEFDEAGKIVSFHSRADRNFRLKAIRERYEAGMISLVISPDQEPSRKR
jgi:hypothetical protein